MANAALPAVEARSIELASLDAYPHTGTPHENLQSAAPTTHACSPSIVSFQFSRDGGALLGRQPASPTSGKIWWCIPAALILPHASKQLNPTIRKMTSFL